MTPRITNAEVKSILAVLRRAEHKAQQEQRPYAVVLNLAGELCVVPHSDRVIHNLIEVVHP